MKGKRIIKLITTSVLSILSLVFILSFVLNFKDNKNDGYLSNFTESAGYYRPDGKEILQIGEGRKTADAYKSISDLYTINNTTSVVTRNSNPYDEKTTISISTPEELYAFSYLCKDNSEFLSYNYALINNIDYTQYGLGHEFYPVACLGESFSGRFNGNGYEITGLTMISITDNSLGASGAHSEFSAITYYSMFGVVSSTGVIENLGLVNVNITINSAILQNSLQYVSSLVGLNEGSVGYCYVKDLRDAQNESSGITAAGTYQISGLVAVNSGYFGNSYTALSIVANYTLSTTNTMWHEILLINNNGICENLYFYNASIPIGGYSISGQNEVVVYDATLIGRTLNRTYNGAIYCENMKTLNNSVYESNNDIWYTSGSYGNKLSASLSKINTPILRGLKYNIETQTFEIENEYDYMYMYELFNMNSFFASSSVTYKILEDIDLQYLPVLNYKYDQNISCNIVGELDESRKTVENVDGSYSKYPTIFNATIFNTITTEGMVCYGVFPWFTGVLDGLNFFFDDELTINPKSVGSNIQAIGLVSGFVENGTINNVSTRAILNLGENVGRFYAGGVVGVIGGNGTIENTISTGLIEATSSNIFTNSQISGYMDGVAIGGIVGYSNDSYANFNVLLSTTNIVAPVYASSNTIDVAIGGVIGAGYTQNASSLANKGNITVSGKNYGSLYVSGVIGRLLGVQKQISLFHNQGDIKLEGTINADIYLSGVINADIQTSSGVLSASRYVNSASKYIFYASSFTNSGIISINVKPTELMYSGVANIMAENGFLSTISGFYNLAYKYDINNEKVFDSAIQTIEMDKIFSFGAVISTNATNLNGLIKASYLYNLRNYNFTTSSQTKESSYYYSGCINGNYVTGEELRNEGDLNFNITNKIGDSDSKITIVGIIYEVSNGCSLSKVYNGGDISVNYTANIDADLYVSGISYANRNSISKSDINLYNPTSSNYDSKKTGSLNSVINNGDIKVLSSKFSQITYSTTEIKSANGQSTLGNTVETTFSSVCQINGRLFTSGIVTINESVITNTFNLGMVTAGNYITDTFKTEVNAAGISVLNIGSCAYILNSANNGDIKAINMSSGKNYQSEVNAAGITCRNDKYENGDDYQGNTSDPNSKQIISFTINYGSVYSYNYRYNIASTAEEPNVKSAGILAMGLCNVINVVNYGNIYGSETASGIFGVVYFEKFDVEVSSNIYIANTINYGNVYILERGYNKIHGDEYDDSQWIIYDDFIALTNDKASEYALTKVARNTQYISVIGSVFSIVNFNEKTNAKNIEIRYLTSFNDKVTICGAATYIPQGVSVDVSTFYSAYSTTNSKTGALQADMWMGKFVTYVPLTTESKTIMAVTNISSSGDVTTERKTFAGAFGQNFAFRLAIEGKEGYTDISMHPTDAFILDYFQFVGYKYVNENLLEVIGWRSIAYQTAANDFAQNIDAIMLMLDKVSTITSVSNDALKTDTWMQYLSSKNLTILVDSLIEENNVTSLKTLLQYLFSNDSKSNVLITSEVRENILNKILSSTSEIDCAMLLNDILAYENGYSTILSDAILSDNNEVTEYIKNYVGTLDKPSTISIIEGYIDYLENNDNSYFNLSINEVSRLNILKTIFENIDDELFYKELVDILNINSSIEMSDTLKMYTGYNNLDTSQKKELFNAILNTNVNSIDSLCAYLDVMESEVGYFSSLTQNGFSATSMDNIYSNAGLTSSEVSSSSTVIDNRVALWNQIKDTTTFKNYFNTRYTSEKVYKATEYNNTFQSVTEPHNDGAYIGDTSQNRLDYLYAKNVTPETYFYGPYKSENKDTPTWGSHGSDVNSGGGYTTVFASEDISLWTSNEIMLSRGGKNSTTTFSDALHDSVILMYYDLANEQMGEANKTIDLNGITFKGFENIQLQRHKQLSDPLNNVIYNTSDWTGVKFTTNNYTITVESTGETFSLSDATIGAIYYDGGRSVTLSNGRNVTMPNIRTYICDSNGTYHPVYGNCSVTDGVNTYDVILANKADEDLYDNYSFLVSLCGKRYYSSCGTSSLHSTSNVGIYRFRQPWNETQYFTWKQSGGNKVYTSQYIEYNVNDILNLDGILTEYKDSVIQSADERNIINDIFNKYIINDYQNAQKIIRVSLLESLGLNETNSDKFIDSFIRTNIYSLSLINGNLPFTYLKYNSSQTVIEYLIGLANLSSSNNKDAVILAAVSNKDTYVKLLEILIKAGNTTSKNEYNDYSRLLDYILNNKEVLTGDTIDLEKLSGLDTLELDSYLAPFDNGQISINSLDNITGENLAVVLNKTTFEDVDYRRGLTFTKLNLEVSNKTNIVRILAKSISGTKTLTYSSDTSKTNTISISDMNYYELSVSSLTNIVLETNNDIVIYQIDIIIDTLENSTKEINTPLDNVESLNITRSNILSSLPEGATIDSVNATFTVTSTSGTALNAYVKYGDNKTDTHTISEDEVVNYDVDITQFLDMDITLGKLAGGDLVFTNYTLNISYHTGEYSISTITNDSIERTGLLNLDIILYSEAYNRYLSYVMHNSANYNKVFNNFLNDVVVNMAPLNTSDSSSNPINLLINSMDYNKKDELARLLLSSYNECFSQFIDILDTKQLIKIVYESLAGENNGYTYFSDIIANANDNNLLTSDFKKVLNAAYITADYSNIYNQSLSNSNVNVSQTVLKEQLLTRFDNEYQYINSDGTFDNNKFEALCNYINYSLGTTGYGIYALASSKGILNGEFLPDNLVLDSMDAAYVVNKVESNLETTSKFISVNNVNEGEYTYNVVLSSNSVLQATSDKKVEVKTTSISYDGQQFNKYVSMGGKGSKTNRSIKLTLNNRSNVRIYGAGTSGRVLAIYDSEYNNILAELNVNSDISHKDAILDAGEYYIASTNSGLNFYGVLVEEISSSNASNSGTYLTDTISSSWRGTNDKVGSVNNSFNVEMKQLVKSISTTIFTLDLITSDGLRIYSSESSIDLTNNIITYYVPKDFDLTNLTIDTFTMSLANNAKLYLNNTLVRKGSVSSTFNLNVGDNTGIIKVQAEEESVVENYTIIVVEADFSFDIREINNVESGLYTVEYKDGIVRLELTSPSEENSTLEKLPNQMDITPYISIRNSLDEVMDNAYLLLEDPIIDETGSTNISMEILSTLPTGTYDIVVDIYGSIKKYQFIKKPSTEHKILKFEYNGKDISNLFTKDGDIYVVNSDVLYGRAYDYLELTDVESSSFYLSNLEYSSGATLNISATYNISDTTNLMTYTVVYVITAEDTSSQTYKHVINEIAPYESGSQYVSSYQNGDLIPEQTKIYSNDYNDNIVYFSFERGTNAINRVKYSLTGFYTLGDIKYSYNLDDEYPQGYTAVSVLTAGLSIVVSEAADAGVYIFNYVYTSKGLWNDGEYERVYNFPEVKVEKLASKDSLLHTITFISGTTKLSTLSTVMYPESPIRPTSDALDDEEVSYSYLSASAANNKINVTTSAINYNSYASSNDFYIIGSVTNVNLASYSPTFEIEEYAKIYQYTTLSKLRDYGSDNHQTKTDTEILSNHDSLYLYVPYTSDNESTIKIFLVEVDTNNNNKWIRAYNDTWDGVSSSDVSFNQDTKEIAYDGKTYEVSNLAGTTSAANSSLYMNYIGNPLADSNIEDDINDSHFWYVSYVVFSEDALSNGTNKIQYYHVSMIDLENTNYFVFTVSSPSDLELTSIYLTLVYNVYDSKEENYQTKSLSLFVNYDRENNKYYAVYDITLLPRGYYYFTISLPNGYEAYYEVTNGKVNTNNNENELGAYLPPASIIIQEIDISITITKTDETVGDIWGLGTTSTQSVRVNEKKSKSEAE